MHVQRVRHKNIRKMPWFKGKKPASEKNSKTPASVSPAKQKKLDKCFLQAAKRGKINQMKMLLDEGADINAIDYRGHSALAYLVRENDITPIKFLIDAGVDLNAENNVMAVYFASHWSHEEMVELMLESGLRVDNETGRMAIYAAEHCDAGDIVVMLKKHGARK